MTLLGARDVDGGGDKRENPLNLVGDGAVG